MAPWGSKLGQFFPLGGGLCHFVTVACILEGFLPEKMKRWMRQWMVGMLRLNENMNEWLIVTWMENKNKWMKKWMRMNRCWEQMKTWMNEWLIVTWIENKINKWKNERIGLTKEMDV